MSTTPAPPAPRVLIVDDEPGVRLAIGRILERAGYAVRIAASAEAGVAELGREPAELVITDMIMPQQNGAELITILRRDFPATRVVAMSGGGNFWPQGYQRDAITTSAYLALAEKSGADGILPKPFETAELLAVVDRVVGPPQRAG
ncbi:MAG: response regulator [Proteobacteria bacterium]|nr:response regulator [Pseudomonadota bacterium]